MQTILLPKKKKSLFFNTVSILYELPQLQVCHRCSLSLKFVPALNTEISSFDDETNRNYWIHTGRGQVTWSQTKVLNIKCFVDNFCVWVSIEKYKLKIFALCLRRRKKEQNQYQCNFYFIQQQQKSVSHWKYLHAERMLYPWPVFKLQTIYIGKI